MNGHSNYDYACDDAKFLRTHAERMSYNDGDVEAAAKHRFNEIAMRLETKFYVPRAVLEDDFTALVKPRNKSSTAPDLLAAAEKHMRDRAATYDKPEGERSMGKTVEAFNVITGRDLTESEGWLLMAVLKAVRSQTRAEPHRDSIEDLIAYAGLFGEARLGGR